MAASLRHPLSGLVWLAMAVIYLPILPAGVMLFAPALSAANWQRLLNDPQLPQAAIATLVSTLIATLGALFIALSLVALFWPGKRWRRLSTRLPWLLAVPHASVAPPKLPVRLMRGKNAARAAPMLASVACNRCSAATMSGRWSSNSEGRPDWSARVGAAPFNESRAGVRSNGVPTNSVSAWDCAARVCCSCALRD